MRLAETIERDECSRDKENNNKDKNSQRHDGHHYIHGIIGHNCMVYQYTCLEGNVAAFTPKDNDREYGWDL